jgi:hypothetical protein
VKRQPAAPQESNSADNPAYNRDESIKEKLRAATQSQVEKVNRRAYGNYKHIQRPGRQRTWLPYPPNPKRRSADRCKDGTDEKIGKPPIRPGPKGCCNRALQNKTERQQEHDDPKQKYCPIYSLHFYLPVNLPVNSCNYNQCLRRSQKDPENKGRVLRTRPLFSGLSHSFA